METPFGETTISKVRKEIKPTKSDYAKFRKELKILIENHQDIPYQQDSTIARSRFRYELKHLINCHSMENGSNTPDLILAKYLDECVSALFKESNRMDIYLVKCLKAFNKASRAREKWFGKSLKII